MTKAASSIWTAELRLLLRSGRNLLALILLFMLSGAAVWAGIAEIERQRATIEGRLRCLASGQVDARCSHKRTAGQG